MTTGTIFDIKGFALSDGPGIRTTVFLKGCPLRCAWCHNPEGLSPHPEAVCRTARCTGCGRCREKCAHDDCQPYGRCLHVCPFGNISAAGTVMSSDELAEKLSGDRDIFGSDGGVTFSGGEPMMQAEFVRETAEKLNRMGIHTAVETSSFASAEAYRRVVGQMKLVLADIKLMDADAHRRWCGADNGVILENLRWLKSEWAESCGGQVIFRVPLIPDITDTDENLAAIADFIGDHPVELLTYNVMAGAKYSSVGREFAFGQPEKQLEKQNEEKRMHILSLFENAKIR